MVLFVFNFQPDELYFEEGDILYISDTVRKTSDSSAAFLLEFPSPTDFASAVFLPLLAFCASLFWWFSSVVHPWSDFSFHYCFTSCFIHSFTLSSALISTYLLVHPIKKKNTKTSKIFVLLLFSE